MEPAPSNPLETTVKKLAAALAAFVLATAALVPGLAPDASAGAFKGAVDVRERVEAHDTDAYNVVFRGGQLAAVSVSGDGDTDLDCFVYDEDGSLVAKDDDSTDECRLTFRPQRSMRYRVEIVNLGGVYNAYHLRTN